MSSIHLRYPVVAVIHTAENTFSQSPIHSGMKTSKKFRKFKKIPKVWKKSLRSGTDCDWRFSLPSLAKQFQKKKLISYIISEKKLISYIIIVQSIFSPRFLPFLAIFNPIFKFFLVFFVYFRRCFSAIFNIGRRF